MGCSTYSYCKVCLFFTYPSNSTACYSGTTIKASSSSVNEKSQGSTQTDFPDSGQADQGTIAKQLSNAIFCDMIPAPQMVKNHLVNTKTYRCVKQRSEQFVSFPKLILSQNISHLSIQLCCSIDSFASRPSFWRKFQARSFQKILINTNQ